CRFEKVPASHGTVLSLLVMPAVAGATDAFWDLVRALLDLTANAQEADRPVARGSLRYRWPPPGLDLEARARNKPGRSLLLDRIRVAAKPLVAFMIFGLNLPVGRFRPQAYLGEVIANSDFRKFDDGLRMTLDCTPALADRIERLLDDAQRHGIARYGLHRQA